ncbi:MAG: hypothetical protein J0L92_37855 [Deltaproteobacteria bacterium]|nr:hypothetical protein [Deltaproteobacteria bacterium]
MTISRGAAGSSRARRPPGSTIAICVHTRHGRHLDPSSHAESSVHALASHHCPS